MKWWESKDGGEWVNGKLNNLLLKAKWTKKTKASKLTPKTELH